MSRTVALFSLVIAFLFSFTVQAGVNMDSLRRVLKNYPKDSASIERMLETTIHSIPTNEEEAQMMVFEWALVNAKKINCHKLVAASLLDKAQCLETNFKYEQASRYLEQGLTYAEKHHLTSERTMVLMELARLYGNNRQFEKAEEYYLKCLSIIGKEDLFNVYNGLAVVNLQMAVKDAKRKKRGLYYFKQALQALDTTHVDGIENLTYLYINLSEFYNREQQYDSSLLYLAKAKPYLKPIYTDPYYSYNYFKGRALAGKGMYQQALDNFKTGLLLARKGNVFDWVFNYYLELSDLYKSKGDYVNALSYFKHYHSLHDSILNAENFGKAADIQNQYEREKREKEIVRLHRESQIKELRIERNKERSKKWYILIICVCLGMVGLVSLMVVQVRSIRHKRTSYNLLQQKNIDIQLKSEKLARQAKLISRYQGQMNPHFIFNAVNNVQGFILNKNKERTVFQLNHFKALTQQTVKNSDAEWIPIAEELDYLHNYILFEQARFTNKFDFVVSIAENCRYIVLPPMLLQPIVENAVKYAGLNDINNGKITIEIKQEGEFIVCTISDNGKGFEYNESEIFRAGHALSIMKSRLQLVFETNKTMFKGEYLTVRSLMGAGTSVTIVFPFVRFENVFSKHV